MVVRITDYESTGARSLGSLSSYPMGWPSSILVPQPQRTLSRRYT